MEFLMRKNLAALVVAATIPAAEAADYKIDESRSLAEVNALELKPGDRVLFRRGGVWRGQLLPKSGESGRPIVYGAYGEGAKPVIEPSRAKNAETDWQDAGNGLWRTETGAKADIGNIVFDHGAAGCAFKRDKIEDVKGELDFWCDPETRAVLIRSDRNPARTFASIELCEKVHAVQSSGGHDIEIDGLWIRYSAAHGVGVSNVARFNVRNCDISWIGGGIQYRDDHGNGVRFGNGVEFWADAEDCTVERNRLWEIWDAALSNQSGGGSHVQKGIRWLGNEVWNSEYSFEYWQSSETSVTDGIVVRDNVFRDAGSGWGHRQRWNPNAAHLMFYDNCAKMEGGFIIENNVFSRSKDTLMRLFNDWRTSMTFRGNRWHSDGEPLCRYHGRPVKGLKYRYPMRLDRNHDDSRIEIEEQGFGARVFSADEKEAFEKFLSDRSFSSVMSRIIPAPRKCAFGTGFRTYGEKGVPRSQIVFLTDASLPAEGYRLTVGTNGVEIVSADDAGAFYAMQTLRQVEERRGKETRVPYVRIEDWPAFRWRGMHFDDCRHFFGRETLMKTLDVMAQYKYNVLCWHLTEDQGWRLEIPGRPELVKYGSVRSGLPKHRAWTRIKGEVRTMDMNGMRYGPFYYTEKDVRDILAYAAERHIMIVPEIEMPGHIKAALAAYPQYACFPENLASREPRTVWGIEKDVLCLGNPEALAFVDEVLAYVAKLFPSPYIVFWGEECPTDRWERCPKCRALMEKEGIDDPKKLLGWFSRRMIGVIEKLGKRAIGADDHLVFPETPKSMIGMYWRGSGAEVNGARGVQLGFDMIMIPHEETYFHYAQGLSADVDPFQYGERTLSLERTYRFDPAKGVPADLRHRVLGGMGCNWSEFIWNEYDLQWKMWPRGCAMAEVLWTGEDRPGYADFLRRVECCHRVRLISQGVNCAPVR